MCSEAPTQVMHLEHIGVTFHRNDKASWTSAPSRRLCQSHAYVADITGQAICTSSTSS